MSTHRLSLFVPLFIVSIATAQGEVEARSKVAKGASVWLVHESTLRADVQLGAQEFTTAEKVAWTLHVQATDVDADGNYQVTTKIVRVHGKLELAGGQGEAEFDSAAPDDASGSPIARQAAARLIEGTGKSFRCKVSPRGEVIELGEGAKELIADGPEAGSVHERNEPTLRQLVEQAFGTLPPKRTAAGAKWKHVAAAWFGRMPTRQPLDVTLSEVDLDHFVIEVGGTVELDIEAAKKAAAKRGDEDGVQQLEKAKITNGKATGKQRTSRQDGFVLAAESACSMDMETEGPNGMQGTVKMQMTTATTRTTEAAALPKKAATEPKGEAKAPADDKKK